MRSGSRVSQGAGALVVALAVVLPGAGPASAAAPAATPRVSVDAAPGAGAHAAAPTATGLPAIDTPAPGGYRTVPATRVVDTRKTGGRLSRGGRLVVPLVGAWGLPPTQVGAVQVHVTATGASRAGHLTVHPSDVAVPRASSLNYAASRPVANTVTARPGPDGAIVVTNGAASVDVVLDLVGWFVATPLASSPGLHAIAPTRAWDGRTVGTRVGRTGVSVTVVGGAVPAAATAVVANLTTVNASASGIPLLSWATGQARPTTSNGNTVFGGAVATQVLVGVGTSGRISVATGSGSTDVVVDVLAYVLGTQPRDGRLATVAPMRLSDTRSSGAPLASGKRLVVQVARRGGVPTGAPAAVVTLTSVPGATSSGTLVAFGHGEPLPATSDVNARTDVPVARQVVVALGVDGALEVARAGGSGHLVVDLVGYVTVVPRPMVVAPSETLLRAGVGDDLGPVAAQVLLTTVRHGLVTWWPSTAPALLARPMDRTAPSDSTDAVRRLAMEALAVSTALATGVYDADAVGVSQDGAVTVVRTVLARVACRHRATVVGGWGRSWQSTLWSSIAARAAWLSWSALPATTQECVRAMVLSEADFSTTLRPYYLADRLGRTVRPGNTGAEENSWFALAPAVAVAMMPSAERRDAWRSAQVRLLAASWLSPLHLAANPVVDGTPLGTLVAGTNVLVDGTVVNHDRIAPDYSTNTYQNIDAVLVASLAGHLAPEASLLGLREVYAALGTNTYRVTDGYLPPGGTIYRPRLPDVYYPQGCDWGTGQQLPYALLDAQAALLGLGGPAGSATDALDAAGRHLAAARAMQGRSGDGRMYTDPAEYTYIGREEHTAQLASQLVLSLVLTGTGAGAVAPADVVVTPDAQLRTPPAPVDESRLIDPAATAG